MESVRLRPLRFIPALQHSGWETSLAGPSTPSHNQGARELRPRTLLQNKLFDPEQSTERARAAPCPSLITLTVWSRPAKARWWAPEKMLSDGGWLERQGNGREDHREDMCSAGRRGRNAPVTFPLSNDEDTGLTGSPRWVARAPRLPGDYGDHSTLVLTGESLLFKNAFTYV